MNVVYLYRGSKIRPESIVSGKPHKRPTAGQIRNPKNR